MTEGKYQFPSTTVRKTYRGDRTLASAFDGDARKLLYELKNLMRLGGIRSRSMTRIYTDGTVITAKSHFDMDSVEIDVTGKVGISCTITLIDLPTAIPPMKNNGMVTESEVEGIDYIKTYYIADTAN